MVHTQTNAVLIWEQVVAEVQNSRECVRVNIKKTF